MSTHTPTTSPPLPAPDVHPDEVSERFWSELGRGRITLGWCTCCDAHIWPPAARCRQCMHPVTKEHTLPGTGRVHTYTVVHRPAPGFPAPYVLAYIDLDGGPTVLANIVDSPLDEIRVDATVALTRPPTETDAGAFRFQLTPEGTTTSSPRRTQ